MNREQQADLMYKIVLVGSSGVGKTNIISRYTKNKINDDQKTTIGVQYASKKLKYKNKLIKLQIWDTAGQDRYKSIARAYYKGAIAAFLVYDISNQKSFFDLQVWYNELLQNCTRKQIIVMLIGNKHDLQHERVISKQSGQQFADQRKLKFFQVSAFSSYNIDLIFTTIVEEIYNMVNHLSQITTIQLIESFHIRNDNVSPNKIGGNQKEGEISKSNGKKKCC